MKNYYKTFTNRFKAFAMCSMVLLTSVTQAFSQCFTATISPNSVLSVACKGDCTGSATATVQGGSGSFVYGWSSGTNSPGITKLCAGTYSVTIVDAVNTTCSQVLTATVTEPPAIATSTSSTPAMCGLSNGSATVIATGGTGAYTYSWTTGATTQTITGLIAGTYTVTVEDVNRCTKTAVATVSSNPSPTVAISSSTNVSCNGGNNGSATATATGGTPAYTYSWSNGGTTAAVTGLIAGSYTVSVTDASGCMATSTIILTSPKALSNQFTIVNTTCGQSSGSAAANVSGGTPAYTYAWSNGSTAQTASNITTGSYTLTITDSKGCTMTNVATINCTTGINENQNSLFMSISPNPSQGSFVLESKFEKADRTSIILTNILGETVMLIDNIQQAGAYKKQVDIEHLSNGIYFLVVQQNNERLVKKIVNQ